MRFTFDPRKRAANLKNHGLDLADAQAVIKSGATVTFEDRRFDYGEERFVTIGPLGDLLVTLITVETEDEIRSISMWESTSHEKETYREELRESADYPWRH